jgi:L-serine dehydratase
MDPDNSELKNAVQIAEAQGKKICFKKASLGFHHPNEAKIIIYDENGNPQMSLLTYSVGGGMFEITELDDFSVMIDGSMQQAFIACDQSFAKEEVERFLQAKNIQFTLQEKTEKWLFSVKPITTIDINDLVTLRGHAGVIYVRLATPVLPVKKRTCEKVPFGNATQAMDYYKKTGANLWDMAIAYECGIGDVSEVQVWEFAKSISIAMRKSLTPPDPATTEMTGFLPYSCMNMEKCLPGAKIINTGLLQTAMMAAIAVMENSCAHNIVVAAPTAGSSGVVPAAIVSIGDQLELTSHEIEKALLVSGLVGAFIANQATFGGEVGACQAENGSASAMAAAGIVQMCGGTIEQAFRASSMALQNMLGLVCDPVAGLTEIPCISRNVSALANAVMSANMVILGFDPVIPLDETIITMSKVGDMLPSALKCTCKGGLCTSPTGSRLMEQISSKHPVL